MIIWLSVLHFKQEIILIIWNIDTAVYSGLIIDHIIIGGPLDNMFMVLVYMKINQDIFCHWRFHIRFTWPTRRILAIFHGTSSVNLQCSRSLFRSSLIFMNYWSPLYLLSVTSSLMSICGVTSMFWVHRSDLNHVCRSVTGRGNMLYNPRREQ